MHLTNLIFLLLAVTMGAQACKVKSCGTKRRKARDLRGIGARFVDEAPVAAV